MEPVEMTERDIGFYNLGFRECVFQQEQYEIASQIEAEDDEPEEVEEAEVEEIVEEVVTRKRKKK